MATRRGGDKLIVACYDRLVSLGMGGGVLTDIIGLVVSSEQGDGRVIAMP